VPELKRHHVEFLYVGGVMLKFYPNDFEKMALAELKKRRRPVTSLELADLAYGDGRRPTHWRRSVTVRMCKLASRLAESGVELQKFGGVGVGVSYSL
jgi:hypothetical protein